MRKKNEKKFLIKRAYSWVLLLAIFLILNAQIVRAATELPKQVTAELSALDKTRDEAIIKAHAPVADLDEKYLAALTKVKTTARATGNLKKLLAADKEINRMKIGLKDAYAIQDQEVEKLRKTYIENLSQRNDALGKKLLEIHRQYERAIEEMVTELTKAGMIDEALAVESYPKLNLKNKLKIPEYVHQDWLKSDQVKGNLIKTNISDYLPLTEGVKRISAGTNSLPGPVVSLDGRGLPIAFVDGDGGVRGAQDKGNDISGTERVFALATIVGGGRVLAIGHDAVITTNIALYDNRRFIHNAVNWLDKGRKKTLLFHQHYYPEQARITLMRDLKNQGWSDKVVASNAILNREIMRSVGVVVLVNHYAPFQDRERLAIAEFVNNGGGLLMVGLGWGFRSNHQHNPDLTAWETNKLGAILGIKFVGGQLFDPTDNCDGNANHPVFRCFQIHN